MGRAILEATVPIDGFIADGDDRVGPLFDRYPVGTSEADCGDDQSSPVLDDPRIVEGERMAHLGPAVRRDLRPRSGGDAGIEAALREAGAGTTR